MSVSLNKTAGQVERYVELVWPKLERAGGVPETPMNRKERGKGVPPVGDYALRVMFANWESGDIEFPEDIDHERRAVHATLRHELHLIESGGNGARSASGIPFTEILQALRYDPGVITTWRAGETKADKAREQALWEVCRFIAWIILYTHPGANLRVVTSPDDSAMRQSTRKAQVAGTSHTNRIIMRHVEALEADGYEREQAKRELAHDPDNTWSYPRVERAITESNKVRRVS